MRRSSGFKISPTRAFFPRSPLCSSLTFLPRRHRVQLAQMQMSERNQAQSSNGVPTNPNRRPPSQPQNLNSYPPQPSGAYKNSPSYSQAPNLAPPPPQPEAPSGIIWRGPISWSIGGDAVTPKKEVVVYCQASPLQASAVRDLFVLSLSYLEHSLIPSLVSQRRSPVPHRVAYRRPHPDADEHAAGSREQAYPACGADQADPERAAAEGVEGQAERCGRRERERGAVRDVCEEHGASSKCAYPLSFLGACGN